MTTFRDIYNMYSAELVIEADMMPILDIIGGTDIEDITPELLADLFGHLYDEQKIVGSVYGKYRKAVDSIMTLACEKGYTDTVSKVSVRSYTTPNLYNKPDAKLLDILLLQEDVSPAATAVILAWQCGLKRCEISTLQWNQVDFSSKQLTLSDRAIPLTEKALRYLDKLHDENSMRGIPNVMISAKQAYPVSEPNISMTVKRAFGRIGLNEIRLTDLRFDYIINLLNENDWEYVSYVAGVDLPSLQEHYLPYTSKDSLRIRSKGNLSDENKSLLRALLEEEGASIPGLAIRFMWDAGVPRNSLPNIMWSSIDLEAGVLNFDDRSLNIDEQFCAALNAVCAMRNAEDDHVFLSENTSVPVDAPYIHKRVLKSMVRRGIFGVGTTALYSDYWLRHPAELSSVSTAETKECSSVPSRFSAKVCRLPAQELLSFVQMNKCVSLSDLMTGFDMTRGEAKKLLTQSVKNGMLELVGRKYYPADSVVPAKKQHQAILDYIGANGSAASDELTTLLGLADRRQSLAILKPLLKDGVVERRGDGRYYTSQPAFEETLLEQPLPV